MWAGGLCSRRSRQPNQSAFAKACAGDDSGGLTVAGPKVGSASIHRMHQKQTVGMYPKRRPHLHPCLLSCNIFDPNVGASAGRATGRCRSRGALTWTEKDDLTG